MTVSTDKAKETFTGDGGTTVFAVSFRIFKKDDVEVIVDGTSQTLDTDYEITNIASASFDVDFGISSAPGSGETVVVRRSLDIVQETDYRESDPFPAASHEDALDLLTMISQQRAEEIDRSLKAPVEESGIGNLPAAADRRNKFFKFTDDASADPTAVGVTSLGSGNILDEDDFASDSEDDAPSQQSAAAYIASQILDEDDFASDSASKAPSQQSAKEYVTGKQTIWVPAAAMVPTVSNGCAALTEAETTAGRPDMQVLDFDNGSDEHAQFQVAFPKGWNEGTVTFQAFWTTTNTGTDGVAWGLQGVAVSDNGTIDVAYGTAVVVTDANQSAAEDLLVTDESGDITIAGSPAEGDLCFFRVFRDVSDASDDMTEDARLIGIKLFFTTNAPTDD